MDWVFNNTPVFFIRDPAKFPRFIHTQKRDPQTHCKDADMTWDWWSSNPESIHQVMILFSDRGIPKGHQFNHGYSGHTFKFVNDNGEWQYVQIHVRSDQGVQTYTQAEGVRLAGENPDIHNQELFEQIEAGKYPSWTVYVQTMTQKQAEEFEHSVFDLTKVWPHSRYPLRPLGKIVLNRNPANYFAEIEQVAFSPSHLVPGIEPSADPVLQSRLFSYPDTHRHRLGTNYQQIPVNQPLVPVLNFQRDGAMCVTDNGANRPNYMSTIKPLTYRGSNTVDKAHEHLASSQIESFVSQFDRDLDTRQPREFWTKVLDAGAKERLVNNISGALGGCKSQEIIKRQLEVFRLVHEDFYTGVAKKLGISLGQQAQL